MSDYRGSTPANDAESKRIKHTADYLERFVDLSNQTWGTQTRAPVVRGSPYEAASRLTGGRWAFDFARLHFTSAEDHLSTIARILGTGWLPTYAWYGLLRSSLEASGRACWLLQPQLTPRQRQQRGFTEHLVKLQGELKAAPPADRPAIHGKIRSLRGIASHERIQESYGKPEEKGAAKPLTGFGISRPGPSKLLLDLFPDERKPDDRREGELLYHVVSGPPHSEPWALLRPTQRVGPPEGGISLAKIEVDIDALMPVIATTVELHDRGVRLHTRLMGGDESAWEAARGPLLS